MSMAARDRIFGFRLRAVFSFTPRMKPILISAGHTNSPSGDRGAVGNGYVEGILTTNLRDAVAKRLRDAGHQVIEDGTDGVNDPLKKSLTLAKQAQAAIEFHWNASGNSQATGIEVLSKPNKKALAQRIAQAIHDATGLIMRGEKGWKADNSGQHHRLAFCEAGGLIVEVCFISNPGDMKLYTQNFDAVADEIAAALSAAVPISKPSINPDQGGVSEAASKPGLPLIHTVERGDTLWAIAEKYSTKVETIKGLNNLTTNVIEVGQRLRVK